MIPKWYVTAIRLEKNMITGNARKAKFTIAAWYPTSGMKDVKRKSLPASEKLITFLKILSILEN